jgi:Spy/CpxP family protein refolding chaperone
MICFVEVVARPILRKGEIIMVMRRLFSLLVMVFVLASSSGVVLAQKGTGRLEMLRHYLALTDTQTSQVREALKKHHEVAWPIRQQLRDKILALREALNSIEPKASAVGQLVIAKRALRRQLREINTRTRSDIAAILKPEQKQKFKQLRLMRERRFSRPDDL